MDENTVPQRKLEWQTVSAENPIPNGARFVIDVPPGGAAGDIVDVKRVYIVPEHIEPNTRGSYRGLNGTIGCATTVQGLTLYRFRSDDGYLCRAQVHDFLPEGESGWILADSEALRLSAHCARFEISKLAAMPAPGGAIMVTLADDIKSHP